MAALSVPEMMNFLEEKGLSGGATSAVEGAIGGMVRSIDPEARICTAEEAALIREQWTGAGQAGVTNQVGSVAMFESWPESLAYLKIKGLFRNGGQELLAHLRTLTDGAGVIVDLRGTDGNDMEAVVELASPYYEPSEELFRIENRAGEVLETRRSGEGAPVRAPVMVLIDRDTRCAAETLAALWSGKPGIMLIGEPTRGDATAGWPVSLHCHETDRACAFGSVRGEGGEAGRCGGSAWWWPYAVEVSCGTPSQREVGGGPGLDDEGGW
jgi:C-terminal processing protease CtpA/Prc